MEAIMRKLTAMALSMMFILGSVIPVIMRKPDNSFSFNNI